MISVKNNLVVEIIDDKAHLEFIIFLMHGFCWDGIIIVYCVFISNVSRYLFFKCYYYYEIEAIQHLMNIMFSI